MQKRTKETGTKEREEQVRKIIINSARYGVELLGDKGGDLADHRGRCDDKTDKSRANAILFADGMKLRRRVALLNCWELHYEVKMMEF